MSRNARVQSYPALMKLAPGWLAAMSCEDLDLAIRLPQEMASTQIRRWSLPHAPTLMDVTPVVNRFCLSERCGEI